MSDVLASEWIIRPSKGADVSRLKALYADTFPEEDLWPLVTALMDLPEQIISLVAARADEVIGHVSFTWATDNSPSALLGPLCVQPSFQNRGVGTSLVAAGLEHLAVKDCHNVFVLGDPNYYARFGFDPETETQTPCPIPSEWANAWQSLTLPPADLRNIEGSACGTKPSQLKLPEPWNQPELWAP